ncbi:alanine transaminase [Malassezia pachydermatis]|uniref:Glutamate pyruvate transaminase n=1 Tax=Malassezia pachydermatis TaxID=77020 RepID=A0A0N0RS10_9BASI|nr:alt1-alanine aminotransferase [Malassezia pachydermatis]KOS13295.1 alt1-alanine aminotransferase [Malassezia pachydermatis]
MTTHKKALTIDTINPNVLKVHYAVRGEIPNKAAEFEQQLHEGKNLPFDSVVWTNIGNPQQQPNLGQEPLTFWRQVSALTEYPALLDMPAEARDAMFPADTQERARELLEAFGSVGAYTSSKGVPLVRRHVAEFLKERDGHDEDIHNIYLTAGASAGISLMFQVFFGSGDGVLIPIPQYPLYSATLSLLNVEPMKYSLRSDHCWDPSDTDVRRQIDLAVKHGIKPRAIVVINPGNPTGSCMSKEQIYDVIKVAYEFDLAIFADEVYQVNIYQKERPFASFRKVLLDLRHSSDPTERDMSEKVELASLHSTSKGVAGECGRRGGFFVLNNFDADVEAQVNKMASIGLCPPTQGQIGVDLLVRPPKPGDPSYELYAKQIHNIHETLHQRSLLIAEKFNELEGVKADPAMGALYMFPRLHLPKAVADEAEKVGKKVDELYCMELLKETGICVVPGSGFGYTPRVLDDGSSYSYFRTTLLAKATDKFVERYVRFHKSFMERYKNK